MKLKLLSEADIRALLPTAQESFLRQFCELSMQITDAPLAYHVANGFGMLAFIGPMNLTFEAGTPEPSVFFGLSIGAAGSGRKSSGIAICKRLIELAGYGDHLAPQIGSAEGLMDQFVDRNAKLAFLIPEFGNLLQKTNKEGGGDIKTKLNDVFDKADLSRALAKKKSRAAPKDYHAILLAGCSDAYIKKWTTEEDWSGGFYRRMFIAFATRERDYSQTRHLADEEKAFAENIRCRMAHLAKMGPCLGFDEEAAAIWDDFYAQLSRQAKTLPPHLQPILFGAQSIGRRLCLLMGIDHGAAYLGQPWKITGAQARCALGLLQIHISSALTLAATVSASGYEREQREILDFFDYTQPRTIDALLRKKAISVFKLADHILTLRAAHRLLQVHGRAYIRVECVEDNVLDTVRAEQLQRLEPELPQVAAVAISEVRDAPTDGLFAEAQRLYALQGGKESGRGSRGGGGGGAVIGGSLNADGTVVALGAADDSVGPAIQAGATLNYAAPGLGSSPIPHAPSPPAPPSAPTALSLLQGGGQPAAPRPEVASGPPRPPGMWQPRLFEYNEEFDRMMAEAMGETD